ncbi:MAG: hypothetical protein Q4F99_05265 [bacterium]|nr:hypothetical protein [bacterium]
MSRCSMLLFILLFPVLLVGASIPNFTTNVDAEGVRFRLPSNAAKQADEALETFRYWRQMPGQPKEELECYNPDQLWRIEQHKGLWEDKDGNSYEFVKPFSRKHVVDISNTGREHATREEYDQVYENQSLERNELVGWIADWTGEEASSPTKLKGAGAVLGGFFCTTDTYAILILYFRADRNQPYMLIVKPNETEPAKWKSTLSRAMSGFSLNKNNSFAGNEKIVKGGWYSIEKPPYRIHTDLAQKNRKSLNDLLNEIQLIRKEYTKLFPEPYGTDIPTSVIRIFSNPDDYREYVGPDHQWSSGLFSTTHRELLVRADDEDKGKERKDEIREIAFHEGWHQYFFLITPAGSGVPIWFNEGFATYFETFRVSNKVARPRKSKRASQALALTHMHTVEGLKTFMSCTTEDFYGPKRLDYYAMAWAITATIVSSKDPLLKGTLQAYYKELIATSPEAAREKIFTDEVLTALSEALPKFLKKAAK